MNKILWLDTETTGVDEKIHDVIQIGFELQIDGLIEEGGELFMAPVSEINGISPKALETNGRTLPEIMAFPPAQDQITQFFKILAKHIDPYKKTDKFIMAGYNVRFDYDMLRAMWDKVGREYFGSYIHWIVIDVATVVAEAVAVGAVPYACSDFRLSTLCKFFGISLDAHDALDDIKATRCLYEILVAQREVRAINRLQQSITQGGDSEKT